MAYQHHGMYFALGFQFKNIEKAEEQEKKRTQKKICYEDDGDDVEDINVLLIHCKKFVMNLIHL